MTDLNKQEVNNMRFIGATAPVITVTKWHDLEERTVLYDLYLNGKVDGRYTLEGLTKRIQEVMLNV